MYGGRIVRKKLVLAENYSPIVKRLKKMPTEQNTYYMNINRLFKRRNFII